MLGHRNAAQVRERGGNDLIPSREKLKSPGMERLVDPNRLDFLRIFPLVCHTCSSLFQVEVKCVPMKKAPPRYSRTSTLRFSSVSVL